MRQSIANESLEFLSIKARQFGDDFAALFSEYGIKAPVSGQSIADAILQHGKEFATEVHKIITGTTVQYDGFGEKIKGFAQKAGGVINRYNEKRDARKNGEKPAEQAQTPKVEEPEKPKDKSIDLEKPLFIGIGAVVLIVIIILIVKAAN